jgi:hypothetical protein
LFDTSTISVVFDGGGDTFANPEFFFFLLFRGNYDYKINSITTTALVYHAFPSKTVSPNFLITTKTVSNNDTTFCVIIMDKKGKIYCLQSILLFDFRIKIFYVFIIVNVNTSKSYVQILPPPFHLKNYPKYATDSNNNNNNLIYSCIVLLHTS